MMVFAFMFGGGQDILSSSAWMLAKYNQLLLARYKFKGLSPCLFAGLLGCIRKLTTSDFDNIEGFSLGRSKRSHFQGFRQLLLVVSL